MRRAGAALVAIALCGGGLAAQLRAGDQRTGPRFQQQWRIFPHAPFRRPADERITARLTRQIDPLLAMWGEGNGGVREGIGDTLIDSRARNQLFRLESLLRLYVRAFPDLERYRVAVKDLEDDLGDYAFTVDSLAFAEEQFQEENRRQPASSARQAEQQKVLDGLRRKKEAARVAFARAFAKSTLDNDLPALRLALASNFAGWSASRDLDFVTDELRRVLRNVRDGSFNFNLLEDGIHEFRRRLRWFPILIDAFDGLIMLREDPPGACPIPALEALKDTSVAKHRYATPALSHPAPQPCSISRCLLWQVVKTTNELGHLKDDVQGKASIDSVLHEKEIDVAASNLAAPEEIARAKAIRDELLKSRALDVLISQLGACR